MNILVTGGCGFIGSHLIEMLLKRYNDVRVDNIDCLTYCGNLKNTESFKDDKRYMFHQCNISNAEMVRYILKEQRIDTILNLAAQTHVCRSIKNPREFIDTDIYGTFTLATETLKSKTVKSLIHFSTDEVFGPIKHPMIAVERSMLNPTSPYSASKASADLMLLSYFKTYGLPVSIVRPSNNYGIKQYPEKLIPTVITQLLKEEKVPVHGDGSPVREWLHVEDCCNAIVNLLNISKPGHIYNIGSGQRYSNLSIIISIIYLMTGYRGSSAIKYMNFINNRPGNDSRYAIDSTKLISLIGDYVEHKDMLDSLKFIVKWYSNNRDWWQDVDISCNFHSENYLR